MTWEVNNSVLMKIGQILKKEKFIKKLYKNCDIKTSSRPFCVCKELSTTSIGKWNFWSKLLMLDIIKAELLKFVQISMQTSSDCFLKRILRKLKRAWN